MSSRGEWETRYGARTEDAIRAPSQFLVEQMRRLPPGRALDVACGDGRHALHLARHGWTVEAIDFAHAGLARLLGIAGHERVPIAALQADLEHYPLPRERYDVVVNIRFLQRTLFNPLKTALRRGGVLVFETFIVDQRQLGHPRNPAFLLDRGELRSRFDDFAILSYDEGRRETESGPAFLARMLAQRP